MPSKKVFIKCNRAFIHGQIRSEEALAQLSLANKALGSYFVNKNSTRKGTGLTEDEIKVFLPLILNLPVESIDFRKEVDKYYTEINTRVPYGDKGVELEIGLTTDNAASPLSYRVEKDEAGNDKKIYYNLPIALEDYIKVKHAKGHPFCALSPKDAKGNPTIMFYIEDPDETTMDTIKESELKDNALNVYQQIKDDPKKVKAVLSLLSNLIPRKPGEVIVVETLSDEQRKIRLREMATSERHWRPFYNMATDPDVFSRYLLNELIKANFLKRAGTSILVAESDEVLGINEQEALNNLFKNPANAQLLNALKAQMKEKQKIVIVGK